MISLQKWMDQRFQTTSIVEARKVHLYLKLLVMVVPITFECLRTQKGTAFSERVDRQVHLYVCVHQ